MSDFKSKLPNMNEVTSFAGKLFGDIKKSVCEIIDEYKRNHPTETVTPPVSEPITPTTRPTSVTPNVPVEPIVPTTVEPTPSEDVIIEATKPRVKKTVKPTIVTPSPSATDSVDPIKKNDDEMF